MSIEHPHPAQLSFLTPEDAQMVHLMQRFLAEASRLYEVRTGFRFEDAPLMDSPPVAARFLVPQMEHLEQEELRALNLNTKGRLLSARVIYQGTATSTHVRAGEVFRPAIQINATAIIVAHNHPSGDPSPSAEDVHLTRQLVEAGKLLDIDVLDHLIIGQGRWLSMRERGLGF